MQFTDYIYFNSIGKDEVLINIELGGIFKDYKHDNNYYDDTVPPYFANKYNDLILNAISETYEKVDHNYVKNQINNYMTNNDKKHCEVNETYYRSNNYLVCAVEIENYSIICEQFYMSHEISFACLIYPKEGVIIIIGSRDGYPFVMTPTFDYYNSDKLFDHLSFGKTVNEILNKFKQRYYTFTDDFSKSNEED
jgi:hypothetical protein